jgi:antitoxin component YwqK of YwqJK toxin-antitoxin module
MKHILAPILLLTLLFPSLAFGETMDDLAERGGLYYKKFTEVPFTGKVTGKDQGSLKNGKRVGPWVEYHAGGQLWSKGNWKNGTKNGPWVHYYSNSQLQSKGTFKNGEQDGPWVTYHDNGQLWGKGTYKDGKLDGPYATYWALTGQLKDKGTFKDRDYVCS